jgi:hypothetical protein
MTAREPARPGVAHRRVKEATRAAVALAGGAEKLSDDHGFPAAQVVRRWYSDNPEHEDILIPACWILAMPAPSRAVLVEAFLGDCLVLVELPKVEGDPLAVIDAALTSTKEHTEAAQAALALRHGSVVTQSQTSVAKRETAEAVVAAVRLHRATCALDEQAQRDRVVAAPTLRAVRG